MQRYNTFTLIHKALRTMLYDTALRVQQTDFANANEAEKCIQQIDMIIAAFEKHAQHEDNFIQPAIAVYDPELAIAFEKEHEEDEMLGNKLKSLIKMFNSLNNPQEQIACSSAIAKAYIEFMIFNLEHMAKEEMLENPVLWKYYTDEEIMAINHNIVATIPPAEMLDLASWMMRGINNTDAIKWLKGVKQAAPPELFHALLELAARELPGERFDTIIHTIGDSELVG